MMELPVTACQSSDLPCEWGLLDHLILVSLKVVYIAEARDVIHIPGHFSLILE